MRGGSLKELVLRGEQVKVSMLVVLSRHAPGVTLASVSPEALWRRKHLMIVWHDEPGERTVSAAKWYV